MSDKNKGGDKKKGSGRFTRRKLLQLTGISTLGIGSGCLRLQQSDNSNTPVSTSTPEPDPSTATPTSTATSTPTDTPTSSATATPEEETNQENIRAAFVYPGGTESAWTKAHDAGRQSVDDQFEWLETDSTESVAPSSSEEVFRRFAESDYDIIFGTTLPFMDPMISVAQDFPDTYFEICTGTTTRPNMGRYFGRIYEARYLAGIAAGILTETDTLGFVAAFPISEVIRGINSFTLGAASVNDNVSTKVEWVNSFSDSPKERSLAESLIEDGADVIAQHQDTPTSVQVANEFDVWATGYHTSMQDEGGDKYITSPIWNWDVFYESTFRSVRNGTWESDAYWKGLNAGIVDLSEWGPEVPENIKDRVAEVRSQIENDELNVWRNSKFEDASDEFLFGEMDSFVDEIEGEVP